MYIYTIKVESMPYDVVMESVIPKEIRIVESSLVNSEKR